MQFLKCIIPLKIEENRMTYMNNEIVKINVEGTSNNGEANVDNVNVHSDSKVYITQNIYLNKLIINGEPGKYDVKYFPNFSQRIKSFLRLFPTNKQIENAVRRDMLGENIEEIKNNN